MELVSFILSKGIDLKFNGKVYNNNTIYLNEEKYENVDLNILYSALVENYVLVYKAKNQLSEITQNKITELLLEIPVLTSKTFKNNAAVLLNWAKSTDWDGRTAKEIIEDEILC